MAAANEAEARHSADRLQTSPLTGIEYLPERRELDLLRFVESETDDKVARFVTEALEGTQPDRDAVRATLSMDDFYTLLTFGRRCSVRSLRTADPAFALTGLAAMSLIDRERIDWRDASVATSLLAYACDATGVDAADAFQSAAARSPSDIAKLLVAAAARTAGLESSGHRLVEGVDGVGLIWDFGRPYAPTLDLIALAQDIAELLESDMWTRSNISSGVEVPAVWLKRSPNSDFAKLLGSVRGCIDLSAQLPDASTHAEAQHLIAFVGEAETVEDAALIASAAGPGPTGDFVGFGLSARRLFVVIVSRSYVTGVESRERGDSLERFRPRLSEILIEHAER